MLYRFQCSAASPTLLLIGNNDVIQLGAEFLKACPLPPVRFCVLSTAKLAGPILQNESVKVVGSCRGGWKTIWPAAAVASQLRGRRRVYGVPIPTAGSLHLLCSLSWGKNDVIQRVGRIVKSCPPPIAFIAALDSAKLAGPILQNESVKVVEKAAGRSLPGFGYHKMARYSSTFRFRNKELRRFENHAAKNSELFSQSNPIPRASV